MEKLKEVLADGLEFINSSLIGKGDIVGSEKLKEIYDSFLEGEGFIDKEGFLWVKMFGNIIKTSYKIKK